MQEVQQQVRILIAGDDEPRARQIGELLTRHGRPVPEGLHISLTNAADRASRTNPDLMLVLLSAETEAAVTAIRQVNHCSRAYIIAVGPADDARLILKCLHEGADEYLDQSLLADELPAALARFDAKRGLRAVGATHGKVISAVGVSGGAGATTLAANVAGLLARKHQACGLVDLRLHSGDLAPLLNLKPNHTLADFCTHAARLDRSMFDQMFTQHVSGLELLAAPLEAQQAGLVTAQSLRLLLAMGRVKFPYLVLDVDNRLDDVQLEALWQSDLVLTVMRLDFVSVRNARRLLDRLAEIGIEQERIRVVANRYGQARELARSQAESALRVKIDSFVVDDPRRVNRSANEGKLVAIRHGWSTISRNLSALAVSVNGKPV